MATQQRRATAYRCPDCDSDIVFEDGMWSCTGCRYVPRHGAD